MSILCILPVTVYAGDTVLGRLATDQHNVFGDLSISQALTVSSFNRVIIVDGDKYPKTDEGIIAAIAALRDDGGEIFLPEGSYTIDSAIVINKNNVTIRGAGQGTILNASSIAITVSNRTGVVLTNFSIVSAGLDGISFVNVDNSRIQGVFITGAVDAIVLNTDSDNNIITANTITTYSGDGVEITAATCERTQIFGNYIDGSGATYINNNGVNTVSVNNSSQGLQLVPGGATRNVQIETGNLRVGAGSPSAGWLDGVDVYVEGDVEIGGSLSLGGDTTIAGVIFGDDYTQVSGSFTASEDLDVRRWIYDGAGPDVDIVDNLSITGDIDLNNNDVLDVDQVSSGDADSTSPYIDFQTQNNELGIMATNVGIGTSNPDAKLDVMGDISISGGLTAAQAFRIGTTQDAPVIFNAIDDDTVIQSSSFMDAVTDLYVEGDVESHGRLSVAGQLNVEGDTVIGESAGDSVTMNASTVTIVNDSNVVLSGGINGLSFDTTTLSIDASNNRVGVGTTAPTTTLDVMGDVSISGGLTAAQAFRIGTTQDSPVIFNAIDDDTNIEASSFMDAVNDLYVEGDVEIGGRLSIGGDTTIGGVLFSDTSTEVSNDLTVLGAIGTQQFTRSPVYYDSDTKDFYVDLSNTADGLNLAGAASIAGDLTIDTDTFFVDVSTDRVGINQATPDLSLEVGDITRAVDQADGVGIAGDLEVEDFGLVNALRVGTTGIDPGDANLYVEGNSTLASNVTLGDASGDAVLVNAATWTVTNDTNFVLGGGENGLSFDSSTLSIDATDNEVGINTISPNTALGVGGDVSISGSLTIGKAFRVGTTQDGPVIFNAIDDDETLQVSSFMDSVNDLWVEGDVEIGGRLSIGGDTTINGVVFADNFTEVGQDLTVIGAMGTQQFTRSPVYYDSDTKDYYLNLSTSADGLNLAGAANIAGDLSVDSDTFFVDVSTDRVGVNQATPDLALEVGDVTRAVDQTDGVGIAGDLEVEDFGLVNALRVGTTGIDPGDTNFYVEGNSTMASNVTIGDANTDAVLVNSDTWTFANDTNMVLSGGENGLSFDSSTLSIDATDNEVGINTISPNTALGVGGDVSISGSLTIGKAFRVGTTQDSPVVFNAIDDDVTIQSSSFMDAVTDLYIEGDVESHGRLSVAGQLNVEGDAVIGESAADSVTMNASTVTVTSDSNVLLSGGVNGLSFDTTTLSIDASNNRIGVGTTAPTTTLDVMGDVSISGGLTAAQAIRVGYTTGTAVTFNAIDDDGIMPVSSFISEVNDLYIEGDVEVQGELSVGGDMTINGVIFSDDSTRVLNDFTVSGAMGTTQFTRSPVYYDSDTKSYYLDPSNTGSALNVAGDANVEGSATFGDAAGDTITSNAATVTFANATDVVLAGTVDSLNVDDGTLSIDASGNQIGINTVSPDTALGVGGDISASGSLTVGKAFRVGTTQGTPVAFNAIDDDVNLNASGIMDSVNDLFVEGDVEIFQVLSVGSDLTVMGDTVIGNEAADNVTMNASTVTVANDSNVVLSGGVNGLSFDTTTLSIDASNNRVGIGTTAPTTTLDVMGDISISGGLTAAQAFRIGTTQDAPVIFNVIDDDTDVQASGLMDSVTDLFVEGDIELIGDLSVGGDTTITGVIFSDNYTQIQGTLTASGDLDIRGKIFDGAGPDVDIDDNLSIAGDLYMVNNDILEVDRITDDTDEGTAPYIDFQTTADNMDIVADAVNVTGDLSIDGTTLFVDASTNQVGIGTDRPDFALEVGVVTAGVDSVNGVGIQGDLEVEDFGLIAGLRVGTTGTDPDVGNFFVEGNTTLGDASGDAVTSNADVWTFVNDTNVALSGGVNGLSFDTTTLSIDASNNRVGVGTTAPTTTFDVMGDISISGGLTAAQAFRIGTTQDSPVIFNAIDDDTNIESSSMMDAVNDLYVEGDIEVGGNVSIGGDTTINGVLFSDTSTQVLNDLTVTGAMGTQQFTRSPIYYDSDTKDYFLDPSNTATSLNVAGDAIVLSDVQLGDAIGDTVDVRGNIYDTTATHRDQAVDVGDDLSVSGDLTVDNNTLIVASNTNRVGVGTAAPRALLDINGNVSIEGNLSVNGLFDFDGITFVDGGLITDGDIDVNNADVRDVDQLKSTDTDGIEPYLDLQTQNNELAIMAENVGIGTMNPDVKLDVMGDISISGGLTAAQAFRIGTTQDSPVIFNVIDDDTDIQSSSFMDSVTDLYIEGDVESHGRLSVAGQLNVEGDTVIGESAADSVTMNASTVTVVNDSNIVVGGGVNGLSFDTTTLSIDAANNRVGIGTTAPTTTFDVMGDISISGGLTAAQAFRIGNTQDSPVIFNVIDDDTDVQASGLMDSVTDLFVEGDMELIGSLSVGSDTTIGGVLFGVAGGTTTLDTDVVPNLDDTYDLGIETQRWRYLHVSRDVSVGDYLFHDNDGDTHVRFDTDDSVQINAGGESFLHMSEGTTYDMLRGNFANGDIDFRWDGSTNDNVLFVDAGNERVGIGGVNSPDTVLAVVGDISASGSLTIAKAFRIGTTQGSPVAFNAIDDDTTIQASSLMNDVTDLWIEGDTEIQGNLSIGGDTTISGVVFASTYTEVGNDLTVTGAMGTQQFTRSPVYYDSDTKDYYLDASNTTTALNVAGDIDTDEAYQIAGTDVLTASGENTSVGWQTGNSMVAGALANTLVGYDAGTSITTGDYNTFVGTEAGLANNAANNVMIGYLAGQMNTGGANVLIGAAAADEAGDGTENTIVGYQAGSGVTDGDYNTVLGAQAGNAALDTESRNILLGYTVETNNTDDYLNIGNTFYGDMGTNITTWASNDADLNLAGALSISGDLTVDQNTLFVDASADRVGINQVTPDVALDVVGDVSASGSLTAEAGLFLGQKDAGTSNVVQVQRIERQSSGTVADDFGVQTQYYLEDDAGNLEQAAVIEVAWADASDGTEDTEFRIQGQVNSSLSNYMVVDHNSVSLGHGASPTGSGPYNVAVGAAALSNSSGGQFNTALGAGALDALGNANNNVAVGYNAGSTSVSGDGNILIGNAVQASTTTADNEMNIGNTVYADLANAYIGVGTRPTAVELEVLGDVSISGALTVGVPTRVTQGFSDGQGDLFVQNDVEIGGNLSIGGDTTIGGVVFADTYTEVVNELTVTGAIGTTQFMRSPVYYDSDTKDYFLDPSSTATSLNVAGDAIVLSDVQLGDAIGDTVDVRGTIYDTTATHRDQAVDVGDDLSVSGDLTVDNNTLIVASNTNRVGVGTAAPRALLDINGNVSIEGNLSVNGLFDFDGITFVDGGLITDGDIDVNNADVRDVDQLKSTDTDGIEPYLDLQTQNNELAIMAENVGIGTMNPDVKLDVMGDISISGGLTAAQAFRIGNTQDSPVIFNVIDDDTDIQASANMDSVNDLYVEGDIEIGGSLSVGADVTIQGILFSQDYTEITGTLTAGGNLDVRGFIFDGVGTDVDIDDNLSVHGDLIMNNYDILDMDRIAATPNQEVAPYIDMQTSDTDIDMKTSSLSISGALTVGYKNMAVTDEGDFIVGSYQLDDTATGNEDYRLFFDVSKGAFRAGQVVGGNWNDANVGTASFAGGYNNIGSGAYSVALGNEAQSTGGDSVAIGRSVIASGSSAAAFGNYTEAESFAEVVVGRYDTSYTPSSATTFDLSDRQFVVGNGTPAARSDAMVILKNGKVGIGDSSPDVLLDLTPSWNISTSGLMHVQSITGSHVLYVDHNGDFIVGSNQLDDTTTGNEDYRMFFDVSKGAFRAGRVDGSQWDDSFVGTRSAALGYNSTANGAYAMAFGRENIASGDSAVVVGRNSTASGQYSSALGYSLYARSANETAVGALNTDYTPASATAWVGTDRQFVVGNGQSGALSNAMVILKNGKAGFGTSYPETEFDLLGDMSISGSLTVGDPTGITSGFDGQGDVFIQNDLEVGGRLSVGGDMTINGVIFSDASTQVLNDFTVSGAMGTQQFTRSPIYFDSDTKDYYFDPSNTGTSMNVAGGVTTAGGATIGTTADIAGDLAVDTNVLYVNTTTNRVGLGTDDPDATLGVIGDLSVSQNMTIGQSFRVGNTQGIAKPYNVLSTRSDPAVSTFLMDAVDDLFIDGNLEVAHDVSIGGDVTIGGFIINTSANVVELSGEISASGNLDIRGKIYDGSSDPYVDINENLSVNGDIRMLGNDVIEVNRVSGGTNSSSPPYIHFDTTQTDINIAANGVNIAGDLTVDGSTLFVDASTSRVGIGEATPDALLDVGGNVSVAGNLSVDGDFAVEGSITMGGDLDMENNRILNIGNAGTDFTSDGSLNMSGVRVLTVTGNNAAIGFEAGNSLTSSGANTLVGYRSGYNAIKDTTLVAVGFEALYANTTGAYNIGIGYQALRNNSTGGNNSAIGHQALYLNTTGTQNTAMGFNTLVSNSTGDGNSAMGYSALSNNTTGGANSAMGRDAMYANTTGASNSVVGYEVLLSNTTGGYNSAIGRGVLLDSVTGSNNSVVGYQALGNLTPSNSVAVGYEAGFGNGAAATAANANNTMVGYRAGYSVVDAGNNNVLYGYQAGDAITTGDQNIIIGYDVDAPVATGNQQLVIGNMIFGTGLDGTGTAVSGGLIGIGTNAPDAMLDVAGNVSIDGNLSVNGNVNIEGITIVDGGFVLSGDIDMNDSDILDVDRIGGGDADTTQPYLDFNTVGSTIDISATATNISANMTVGNDLTVAGSMYVPKMLYSPSTTQIIAAETDTIASTFSYMAVSANDEYYMTATPSIARGQDGDILVLFNSGSNTIDLQDRDTLPGSGVELGSGTAVLQPGATISFIYNDSEAAWLLQSQPNTLFGENSNILNVRNQTGGAIPAGTVVYASGYQAGQERVLIDLADADNTSAMPAIGITTTAINNGSNGTLFINGSTVTGLNTSSAAIGDSVYVSTTAGQLVFSRPSVDDIQKIGVVTRSHATAGSIFVTGAGRTNDVPHNFTVTKIAIGEELSTTYTDTPLAIAGDISLSGAASIGGVIRVGATDGTALAYNVIDDDSTVSSSSGLMDAANDLYVEGDIEVVSNVSIGGDLTAATIYLEDGTVLNTTTAGLWTDGGSTTYLNAQTDNVAIGAATAAERLDVHGAIAIDGVRALSVSGADTYNTLVGYEAGTDLTVEGTSNTFIGYRAGYSTTWGDGNVGIGSQALNSNTTGIRNVAVGSSALQTNTTGNNNVALGLSALEQNTTGDNNIAQGYLALYSNSTGANNIAVSFDTLRRNTSGGDNIALGMAALTYNTTGNYNIASGREALRVNVSGSNNIASGYQSLGNLTSSNSVAIGHQAGYGNGAVAGDANSNNTMLGYRAGYSVVNAGNNNVLLGYQAGDAITTGDQNIVIGYDVDAPVATGNQQLVIGNMIFGTGLDGTGTTVSGGSIGVGTATPDAMLDVAGNVSIDGNLSVNGNVNIEGIAIVDGGFVLSGDIDMQESRILNIGNNGTDFAADGALNMAGDTVLTISGGSTLVGYQAGHNLTQEGTNNTFVGYHAGYETTWGDWNVAVGRGALDSNVTGDQNIAIGYNALSANVADGNIALGARALIGTSTGANNIGIGAITMFYNSTGSNNIALGGGALYRNTTGYANLALGESTMTENTTGAYNVALGAGAFDANVIGNYNFAGGVDALENVTSSGSVAIGYRAARGNGAAATDSHQYNTVIGYQSGYALVNGDNNVLLGYQAGDAITTGDSNIVIGSDVDTSSATASNELNIGDTIYGDLTNDRIGIGTYANNTAFEVSGDISASGGLTIAKAFRVGSTSSTPVIYNVIDDDSTVSSSSGLMDAANDLYVEGDIEVVSNVSIGGDLTAATIYLEDGTVLNATTAGLFTDGGATTYLTSQTDNLAIGSATATERLDVAGAIAIDGTRALSVSGATTYNTIVGYEAANTLTISGIRNTVAGYRSGTALTTGYDNTFVGYQTGVVSTTAFENTLVGVGAGENITSGRGNTFVGLHAGQSDTVLNGNYNVGIGINALDDIEGSASYNTSLGGLSGEYVTSGTYNTILGYNTGDTLQTGDYNILLGVNADTPAVDTSEYLNIGNTIYGDMGTNQTSWASNDAVINIAGNVSASGNLTVGNTLSVARNDAATNDIVTVQRFERQSTGTAADGFGVQTDYYFENETGTLEQAGALQVYWEDSANNSENTSLRAWGQYDSTLLPFFTINGSSTGIGIGPYANTLGQSVALGYGSLYGSSGTSNVSIGYRSMFNGPAVSNNIAIGTYAGYETTGSNSVFLGFYAGSNETGSNTFYLDNQDRSDLAGDRAQSLMYGQFAASPTDQHLHINANTSISGSLSVIGELTISSNLSVGGAVSFGSVSINKLTVNTIDPVYHIDGTKYSTYGAETIRQWVDVLGSAEIVDGVCEIVLSDQEKGSDLWLFYQAVVADTIIPFVSAQGPSRIYGYIDIDEDDDGNEIVKLIVKTYAGDVDCRFSYRLTGKRLDLAHVKNNLTEDQAVNTYIDVAKYKDE